MIHLKDLETLGACNDARSWFNNVFPDGGELRDILDACDRDDWVCCYACFRSEAYRYWCAGEAMRSAYHATHDEGLLPYVGNVTPRNWREARSAAAYAAASAAAYAAAAISIEAAAGEVYACAAQAAQAATYRATDAADYDDADYDVIYRAEYKRLRAEAERVLLAVENAGPERQP